LVRQHGCENFHSHRRGGTIVKIDVWIHRIFRLISGEI
jgi:hypothetical protein